MTLSELLAAIVSVIWLLTGATFGYRFGCFAALGIGLAAWFVGLVLGAFVTIGHEELSERCRELAERRRRLGTALWWAEEAAFLALYLGLLLGPLALLIMTRPHPPG